MLTQQPMAHLPEDDLPSTFDVVVDGTGLVQSVLAAALARVGKSVLHIDRGKCYGELWASLMHRELEEWVEELIQPHGQTELSNDTATDDTAPPPNEDWIHIKPVPASVSNLQQIIPEWRPTQPDEPQMSTNEQGHPQQPAEVDGTASDPLSDGGQLLSDESETSREIQAETGGDEEAIGEEGVASTAAVSSEREQGREEGVASTAAVSSEQGREGASSVARTGKVNWNSLGEAKRRFNYDILPKVMFCRGSLVEMLMKSNCGRYIEFKAVSQILSPVNGDLEQVPCSRADMFTTKSVSMIDKRKMMRFLSFCADFESHPEQYQEFEKLPFVEFLSKHDLPPNLRNIIIHCIAMVEETTPTIQALKATQLFLTSLGRFGNAPFLYPLYGVGELAQAFCRMCAVFGGVYCLQRHVQSLVVSSESHEVKAIICSTGQRISCSAAVCSVSRFTTTLPLSEALSTCQVSRAIFVTDKPIANTKGSLSVVILPPCSTGTNQTTSIRMLQVNSSTYSSIPGTYVIHASCPSVGSSAEVDLQAVCGSYFSTPDEVNEDKPRLLYALYFNITLNSFHGNITTPIDGLPRSVYLTSDPSAAIGFEGAVGEARSIFEQMCPGEEFLPTPPDPSDIIYDQPSQETQNNTDPQDTTDTVETTDPQDTTDTADPQTTRDTADPQDTRDTADGAESMN